MMSSPDAGATWTELPDPEGSGVVLPVAALVHEHDCESSDISVPLPGVGASLSV